MSAHESIAHYDPLLVTFLEAAQRNCDRPYAARNTVIIYETHPRERGLAAVRTQLAAEINSFMKLSGVPKPKHPTVQFIDVSPLPADDFKMYPSVNHKIAGWAIPHDNTVSWPELGGLYLMPDGQLLFVALCDTGSIHSLFAIDDPCAKGYLEDALEGIRKLRKQLEFAMNSDFKIRTA